MDRRSSGERAHSSFQTERLTFVWWNIDPRQKALIKIDGFIIVYSTQDIMKENFAEQVVVDFLLSVKQLGLWKLSKSILWNGMTCGKAWFESRFVFFWCKVDVVI